MKRRVAEACLHAQNGGVNDSESQQFDYGGDEHVLQAVRGRQRKRQQKEKLAHAKSNKENMKTAAKPKLPQLNDGYAFHDPESWPMDELLPGVSPGLEKASPAKTDHRITPLFERCQALSSATANKTSMDEVAVSETMEPSMTSEGIALSPDTHRILRYITPGRSLKTLASFSKSPFKTKQLGFN